MARLAHTFAAVSLALVVQLPSGPGILYDEPGPAPLWPDAAEIERFLGEARVIERRPLGKGITGADKLTLEENGIVRRAVFKKVDGDFDDWRSEVAAYEMDKLLGLGMVPPAVARRVRGALGCVQLWVEGETLAARAAEPPDLESWRRQVSLMWLFDDLIGNIDRHLNNGIVTPDFQLALIDHSRAFQDTRGLVNDLNRSGASGTRARYWQVPYEAGRREYPTRYPVSIVERLRSLTEEQVKGAVGRYLRGGDRKRILQRRDLILERLDLLGSISRDRPRPTP